MKKSCIFIVKPMQPRTLRLCGLLSFAGMICVLTSCVLGPTPESLPLDNLNRVSVSEQVCSVVWDSPDHKPSPSMMGQLRACLEGFRLTPETYLEIKVPSSLQTSGQGALYAQTLKDALQRMMKLNISRISWDVQSTDHSEQKGLVFDVEMKTYHVTPPACGARPFVMGGAAVQARVDLGCSNMANLGMMVRDPHDLVTGRAVDPSLAAPLVTAVDSALMGIASSSGAGAKSGGSSGGSSSGGGMSGSSSSAGK